MSEHEQRAIRKEAGLNIDPETAEMTWQHGSGLDPYGLHDLTHEKDDYVQRNYFARSPGSEVWVWFGDLPDKIRDALWEKHKSRLAYPAGSGFGPLPPGHDIEINCTSKRPRYLIAAREVLRPDAAYDLVYLKFDRGPSGGGQAEMMGWEWGRKLLRAPVKDFGYGVLSHYIPVRELRPEDELRMLVEQAYGRA
jgi:hypothetical protein